MLRREDLLGCQRTSLEFRDLINEMVISKTRWGAQGNLYHFINEIEKGKKAIVRFESACQYMIYPWTTSLWDRVFQRVLAREQPKIFVCKECVEALGIELDDKYLLSRDEAVRQG